MNTESAYVKGWLHIFLSEKQIESLCPSRPVYTVWGTNSGKPGICFFVVFVCLFLALVALGQVVATLVYWPAQMGLQRGKTAYPMSLETTMADMQWCLLNVF